MLVAIPGKISLFGPVVDAIISAIIDLVSIDENRIKQDVRNSNAVYAEIKKIQPYTMTVDQIDKYGDVKDQIEYNTKERISSEFYEGQRIYA